MSRYVLIGVSLAFIAASLKPPGSLPLLFSAPHQTDNQTARPTKPPQIEAAPAISPYEIASFITTKPDADLRNIWNQLGIKTPHFGWRSISEEQQGDQGSKFLIKCNNCDVETFSCDLDTERGKEVLVKVSDRLSESCRYLVFKKITKSGEHGWKLLGYIDHGFGRYRNTKESFNPKL